MGAKTRKDSIIEILEEQGYVTVKYLMETLHYSSATINRDLNDLQAQHLITRSYGGAELVGSTYVPVPFRSHKMRAEKRYIGRAAAGLVEDGDTIFIDGSTTSQCMEQSLVGRKNLTVITNNILLAANLSTHGVRVICLGGEIVEAPSMLCGAETVENAARYRVDKMFFSTGAVSGDGMIASGVYDLVLRAVAKRARQVVYLVDHKKVDQPFHTVWGDFSEVDTVISDYEFPSDTKARYAKTRFLRVEGSGHETENLD